MAPSKQDNKKSGFEPMWDSMPINKAVLTAMTIAGMSIAFASAEAATIQLDVPEIYDFGDVEVGTTKTLDARATFNLAEGEFFLGGFVDLIAEPGAFAMTPGEDATEIYPNEFLCNSAGCNFTISFAPEGPGQFFAILKSKLDAVIYLSTDCTELILCEKELRQAQATALVYGNATSAVPIPAALPLLATGLGALGFIGCRSKRKVKASA